MAVQPLKGPSSTETTTDAVFAPLLLDVRDVMRLCGVHRHRAMELMHGAGAVRLGRSLRVRPATLDAYLARLEAQ